MLALPDFGQSKLRTYGLPQNLGDGAINIALLKGEKTVCEL
jgi:hypothetical protein